MRSAGTADGDGRRERLQDKQEPAIARPAVAARHDGVRSEKDKVAEQLTDDWENWEIVRTEYVLKGRDTVPDTMRRIPAGIKRVTRVRGIRHSTSVNKKEEQEKTAQSVRLRRTESQTEIAKTVKKSSAGRIALYAIGLVALWLALRSIGKRLL